MAKDSRQSPKPTRDDLEDLPGEEGSAEPSTSSDLEETAEDIAEPPRSMKRGRKLAWLFAGFILSIGLAACLSAYLYLETQTRWLKTRLDATLSLQTSTKGWRFHSRLFSDAFPLTQGRELDQAWLLGELAVRSYQETPCQERLEEGCFCLLKKEKSKGLPAGVRIRLRGWKEAFGEGPAGEVSVFLERGILVKLEGLDDSSRRIPSLEPIEFFQSAGIEGDLRRFVTLDGISPNLVRLVLASEDQRFYQHPGVDLFGVARAAWANLRGAGYHQGASTITQQVVRSFFLSREKRLARKLKEVVLALCLERLLSKDDILELYLNTIYWGQLGGHRIAGVEMASRYYFGLSAGELSPSQAVALTAMIPAPQAYNPFRRPKALAKKMGLLVNHLSQRGILSQEETERAGTSADFRRQPLALLDDYRRFAELVNNQLEHELMLGDPKEMGLVVWTSLDPYLLEQSQQALDKALAEIERFTRIDKNDPLQGAAYAVDPETALVPFVLGGRTQENDHFNRAFMMRRQPGSSFKPVAYIAALESRDEQGAYRFSPTHLVPDMPRDFDSEEGPWRPRNNDYRYHPKVTLAKALAKSINVATSNVVEAVGADHVAAWAEKLGLPKPEKIVPSIGLGTTEATLPQMTQVYLPILRDGLQGRASAIRSVTSYRGEPLWTFSPSTTRVMESRTAKLMGQMLQAVVNGGTAYGLRGLFGFRRPALGKTGTTQHEKDAWFIGATPQLLLTLWVGKDQGGPIHMPANDVAVPIWAKVAGAFLQKRPIRDFILPDGFKKTVICPWTGLRANNTCIGTSLALPENEIPRSLCPESHPPPDEVEHVRERWWEKRARQHREQNMVQELDRLLLNP